MNPTYKTIPVGDEGLYAVQRSHNGEQQYLAQATKPSVIGKYTMGLAKATIILLEGRDGHKYDADYAWLPWHSSNLPTMKTISMYPPARPVAPDASPMWG